MDKMNSSELAKIRVSKVQSVVLLVVLIPSINFFIFSSNSLAITYKALEMFYLLLMIFDSALIAMSITCCKAKIFQGLQSKIWEEDLPIYTILLPLYKEPEVLPSLILSIKKIEYPATKLDVKLLIEEEDQETISALKAISIPESFDVLFIPSTLPKTKPKACNYALEFAKGEYLTIYDAEDIPDPT
jgi:cellulose synthase/poly-beta-1,6-N-acetylglucosamine synthase-like glycosyltransferase